DSTGATRFVCIPIPDRMLPLDWAKQHRDALWARALQQYRSGVPWIRTDEQERLEVEARNADFLDEDPWSESVRQYLDRARRELSLPVKVPDLLKHLEVPKERHNTPNAKRVRDIAERLGWKHRRGRSEGREPREGLWPPEGTVAHVHPTVHTPYIPLEPPTSAGSSLGVHPVHPISQRVDEKAGESSCLALAMGEQREGDGKTGCTGYTPKQNEPAAVDLVKKEEVHSREHGLHKTAPASPVPLIPVQVDGEPGWHLPAPLPARAGPSTRILVVNPQDKSQLVERKRITAA
ncbi:MAG: VapE domain-containing protein, partial [Cyanobium sp.]